MTQATTSASQNPVVFHLFRVPGLDATKTEELTDKLKAQVPGLAGLKSLASETCFNVSLPSGEGLNDDEKTKLNWLLSETYEPENLAPVSFLDLSADVQSSPSSLFVEVGPRLNFSTAWSSNAVTIFQVCGLTGIDRIERSRRFLFEFEGEVTADQRKQVTALLYDRMTECVYDRLLESFDIGVTPAPIKFIPVMEQGKDALVRASAELGLAFDDWDIEFYTKLFKDKMKRNPSDVECFDLAQSNSEHSRHWFFGGNMIIDGEEKDKTLFQMVKETNPAVCGGDKGNSVIAFHDNSSAIRGFPVTACLPARAGEKETPTSACEPARFGLSNPTYHGILTCETHNFPCGIAPFQGAETGTGGRIRDVQATGRGAHVVAGTSSYCVGNLNIPGYEMPWEDSSFDYPANMATPLQIEIEASNGASDYGNKFGEPVICGYTRSFGMRLPNKERREWVKPIMMSAGVGILDDRHTVKSTPAKGMVIVKLGGPAYRIGMGGGAASSKVQDEGSADLDFNAVQRGDAEMENKMNRVIRACVELGDGNPIVSIHDQGAGGNGNVLKEICEPAGAELFLGRLPIADKTMNAMELWGAEYQENNALLIKEEHKGLFRSICERENLPFGFVGEVTGTGRVIVHDVHDESQIPVDLDLEDVLGKMPSKTFTDNKQPTVTEPFTLPEGTTFATCLDRVLRLLQVGSKRFLTNKVDRSVSGLVAQQQCVGPLHTPLADVGVIALSSFGDVVSGVATSVGEQPVKGLLSASSMARMSVGEALTNLVWAKITALTDVKCSGNWMWAAKLPGEGAAMYEACSALRDALVSLGVAVDGGKDSLSMACNVNGEIVKCPGQLAISTYAMVPDVTLTVTPDFKYSAQSSDILFVDLAQGKHRMGGSALAQVFKQIGQVTPDMDDTDLFARAFNTMQQCLADKVVGAGHDVSDGGMVTALLEMAFAGNCGLKVALEGTATAIEHCFAEELGLLIEAKPGKAEHILNLMKENNVPCIKIGTTVAANTVSITYNSEPVVETSMSELRDVWEATGFEMGKLQASAQSVESEQQLLKTQKGPTYSLTFTPKKTPAELISRLPTAKPRVAVLREEGSNGDREMSHAFYAAGFDVWDIALSDLRRGVATLDQFQGLAFVGGFSYADVLDSAKGWAGGIHFNKVVKAQFDNFKARTNTFSLGICNGCQLMALLGWVPGNNEGSEEIDWKSQPRFIHNASEKYESRFPTVKIQEDSNAIMLKGMEGSKLGVWVAHGEGRAYFPDQAVLDDVLANGQAPIRYVDDDGEITQTYPLNPNGSQCGIASLSSKDGRHLAMMPHPERVFRKFQWPYMPVEWTEGETELEEGPWSQIFQNAQDWCVANK